MTSKLKFEKLQLYLYQMKASKPGNLKTDIEYIFEPLVTSSTPLMTPNDLKIEIWKTITLCI